MSNEQPEGGLTRRQWLRGLAAMGVATAAPPTSLLGAEQVFFNNTSSPTFEPVTLGQTYFVVLKLEAHSSVNDVISAVTFAPTDNLPSAEPTTWESVRQVGLASTINGIRLWIGVNTTGEYDEIRMGTIWADVAGGPSLQPGDFNQNGTVDAADYVVWRKNAGGQFTAQDYQVWRQNFGSAASGATVGATVPEPASGVAVLLAAMFVLNRGVGSRRLAD